MASARNAAFAASGVATVEDKAGMGPVTQITAMPISASGTGTLTVRPVGVPGAESGYEAAYDADGAAVTFDLSAQKSLVISGCNLEGVKITSSNSADTFSLVVNA